MQRGDFMQACGEGGTAMADAMRAVLAAYGGALQREAQACIGPADEARDLVQAVLIKAWQRCAGFRGESELFPWLKSMLRHAAIDLLRRRRPEEPLEDDAGQLRPAVEAALGIGDAVETQALAAEREACFRDCAARFAREQPQAAQVVRWIAEDGLTPAEIAPLLGRSAGATREYVSQCRKKARHYFAPWYGLLAGTAQEAAG